MYVDNAGNVGIGMKNPTHPLHVVGDIALENSSLFFSDGIHSEKQLLGYYGNYDYGYNLWIQTGAELIVGAGESASNLIENGLVTGSTPSQGEFLHIASDNLIKFWVGLQELQPQYPPPPDKKEAMIITSSGNVGIGTTSPGTAKLAIKDDNPDLTHSNRQASLDIVSKQGYNLGIKDTSGWSTGIFLDTTGVNWDIRVGGPKDTEIPPGSLSFRTHMDRTIWNLPSVTIMNSGNVGIGTMSPQQKMHISGVMRLEPQSSPPSGALGDLYVGTDGKLYFHNGTQWKEVSLI
jgi:hypothetical protein